MKYSFGFVEMPSGIGTLDELNEYLKVPTVKKFGLIEKSYKSE